MAVDIAETLTCARHVAHKSEDAARVALDRHLRVDNCRRCFAGVEPMGTFFCFLCGWWHIGHSWRNRGRRG